MGLSLWSLKRAAVTLIGRFTEEVDKMQSPKVGLSRRLQLIIAGAVSFAVLLAFGYAGFNHPSEPMVPHQPQYVAANPNYDPTKLALLIENRASPLLGPLLLHFTTVIPQDWRIIFMGSDSSLESMYSYPAVRHQIEFGRIDTMAIPSNMTVGSQEEISVFLTNLWVYETLLAPAENLLIFQSDSIICSNSEQSLNDWIEYDWVGAPWNEEEEWGGNGGLSIRKVSAMIDVLRHEERVPGDGPEDVWLSYRLSLREGAHMANGTTAKHFSGEGVYVQRPMGFHFGGSGKINPADNWGTPEKRNAIFEYCPEVRMILNMDMAQYVPGECGSVWDNGGNWDPTKRSEEWNEEDFWSRLRAF